MESRLKDRHFPLVLRSDSLNEQSRDPSRAGALRTVVKRIILTGRFSRNACRPSWFGERAVTRTCKSQAARTMPISSLKTDVVAAATGTTTATSARQTRESRILLPRHPKHLFHVQRQRN